MFDGILSAILFMFVEMSPYIFLGLIFVGLLNLFISKEFIANQIGDKSILSNLKAAFFGIPLPLCSCGVIPSAVFMSKNGASKGSTVSFLISTPQTGIDSIIATYGMMGPVFAIFRPLAAFVMGVVGGSVINLVDKDVSKKSKFIGLNQFQPKSKAPFNTRLNETLRYAFIEFLDDISVRFVIGVIVAGLIAYFVPDNFFYDSHFSSGIIGMLLMIAIGIPMYICATASIPIALSLMMKGFSPGVAFVFLAAGPAVNIASISIISKTLGRKVTFYYIGTFAILAIFMGYFLDWVFSLIGTSSIRHVHHHEHGYSFITNEIAIGITIFFGILIAMSFYRKFVARYVSKPKTEKANPDNIVKIGGMTCSHCVANVTDAISKLPGVVDVRVELSENSAYINGKYNPDELQKAIESIGYNVIKS